MPIFPSTVNVDVNLIDIEVADSYAKITWSDDREMRQQLRDHIEPWLLGHPIRIEDAADVIVTREIYLRILFVLDNPSPGAAQEAHYEDVLRQIEHDSRIVGTLHDECLEMIGKLWGPLAVALELRFTKHAPDDDS